MIAAAELLGPTASIPAEMRTPITGLVSASVLAPRRRHPDTAMSDDTVRVEGIDHVELPVPDRGEAAE